MATASARAYDTDYPSEGVGTASGWIGFAALMLGLAGVWNIFDGILAVANSRVYTARSTYVFSDLRTWGWIILVLGILQLVAAFSILSGSQIARWFGVAAAGVNSIGQLFFIPAAPFWALAMFTIDMLVIYGLVVYGGRDVEV